MKSLKKWWAASPQQHLKRGTYLASALLPMIIMLGVWWAIGIFPFGSKSQMAVDFSQQYIGFYGFLKHSVLTGDWSAFFYSFSKSIGGDMLGVLGYYLISPFNLFYILIPLNQFKWAVFLTIWLRYGAIALSFAHLLIKRYRGLEGRIWLVPLMATAYALSGMLVSYQMNPIFYDAMIMLPLVILALERVLDGKKPFAYILILALTLLFQFYMGYMISLFVALYTCYYLAPKLTGQASLKEKALAFLKPAWTALYSSLLAVGSVMILLYPIFLNLLTSKAAGQSPMTFSFALLINPLDIISKLMIGGFDTNSWSAGPSLPNLYVGALALIGALLFFFYARVGKGRKIAAAVILTIFFISFINEFANKIWHMGQNPAGFFYRFSWIASFFLVLLAYQALREGRRLSLKVILPAFGLFAFFGYYVASHDYTYIAKGQSEELNQFLADHALFLPLIICLLFSGLAFYIWKKTDFRENIRYILVLVCLLAMPISIFLLSQQILLSQIPLTVFCWLFTLLILYCQPKQLTWLLLSLLTVFELAYNAYLSQVTISYADAYKFSNVTKELKDLSDVIAQRDDAVFYRVGSTFAYSKNDPLLVSYPGLSNFSSNLEVSTRQLFNAMGDMGGNAATFYANGTALTDALYGVRYFLDRKDYSNQDIEDHPDWHFFGRNATRTDLLSYYQPIYENDRFIIYENPQVFSLAFGTNTLTRNIKFGLNNPVSNQNIILSSMSGVEQKYFEYVGIPTIELDNMVEDTSTGSRIFKRIDKDQPGTIRIKFTPQTDYTYYFQAPYGLRKAQGNISIMLNDRWYNYTQSFDQVQLWNLTHKTPGQEMVLQLQTSTEDEINLTNMGLVRANDQAIKAVIDQRLAQNMTVTEWGNTKIKGQVTISDDSDVMMTTIPYNSGWTVKVDGKKVKTSQAWGSLLSFPISSGQHDIEMTYLPNGFRTGLLISLAFISFLLSWKWWDYRKDKKETEA